MAGLCNPSLPKVPGIYQSFRDIKNKYPIGCDLEVIDGVRFIKSIEKYPEKMCSTDLDIVLTMRAKGKDISNKRPWMVLDKEILGFHAYYNMLAYDTSGDLNTIVRKFTILYYLVDNTIMVTEPAEPNSGASKGCFISRQKIPLPGYSANTGPYYKLTDLVVGDTVTFYKKELKITGVDDYTRDFLHKMGITVLENQPIPVDPYTEYRKQNNRGILKKCKSNTTKSCKGGQQALILKFMGYWDNRFQVDGELHFYEVRFFLEDNTMELIEEIVEENNSNTKMRKIFVKRQKFVKRQQLPTSDPWSKPPGENRKQEILKVITNNSTLEYYFKMDKRPLESATKTTYYKCKDLYIGACLNVYGRTIVLFKACDELTKNFFTREYGFSNFEPIIAPKTQRELEEIKRNEKQIEIILKNYDEVLRRRLINKYKGMAIVFGFIMELITDDLVGKERNFMLKYYLNDTDFAVYEYTTLHPAMLGGMFRSKRKFDKHQSADKLFVFHQLAIGVTVTIDEFKFTITDVDDKTLKFMIDNSDKFPHSHLVTLRNKTFELINRLFPSVNEFRTTCFQGRELVTRAEFMNIMAFDGQLDRHTGAVFALIHRRPDPFEPFTYEVLRSVIQDTLRRAQFIHFEGLKSNFRSRKSIYDREGVYIEREEAIKAMKSNKIPLNKDITNILLDKFTENDHGINYMAMVQFMDYTTDEVEHPRGLAKELLFIKPKNALVKVNEFLDALKFEPDDSMPTVSIDEGLILDVKGYCQSQKNL